MTDFNSYMGNIDTDFFRELCLRNGELRYYKRNEFILREGEVGSFFGFIVSGVIKYTCINQTENKTYNVGFSFTASALFTITLMKSFLSSLFLVVGPVTDP